MANPMIAIPARMASVRLPGKPLADINGKPMIVHVLERATAADIGPVVVACADAKVADIVIQSGGHAIMTDPDHPSGSDRIWEAVNRFDADARHDIVVNVQGDLPTLDPRIIHATLQPLEDAACDIATPVARICDETERDNPNVVKAAVRFRDKERVAQVLYFSRATVPGGKGPHYHHIGLYAYRRAVLGRFVSRVPGGLEQRERLEQLRALEAGMRIDAVLVDTVPFGVDTPADLACAAKFLASEKC